MLTVKSIIKPDQSLPHRDDAPSNLPLDQVASLINTTEKWAGIGFWRYDLASGDLFWSDQIFTIYGYEPGTVIPDLAMAIAAYREEDRGIVKARLEQSIATGKPWSIEVDLIRQDGTSRRVRSHGAPQKQEGVVTSIIGIFQDITDVPCRQDVNRLRARATELEQINRELERQRERAEAISRDHQEARQRLEAEIKRRKILEADLRHLAMTDALTNLPNRQAFIKTATQEINRALRFERPLSLIIFDIDHFKTINDEHGHPVGDTVLEAVAAVIRQTARVSSDMHCRWGGEEFCIAAPETDIHGMRSFAERLRQKINALRVHADDACLHVTCSFGIATLRPSDSFATLLKRADYALYAAKRQGRDRIELADNVGLNSPALNATPISAMPVAVTPQPASPSATA